MEIDIKIIKKFINGKKINKEKLNNYIKSKYNYSISNTFIKTNCLVIHLTNKNCIYLQLN